MGNYLLINIAYKATAALLTGDSISTKYSLFERKRLILNSSIFVGNMRKLVEKRFILHTISILLSVNRLGFYTKKTPKRLVPDNKGFTQHTIPI